MAERARENSICLFAADFSETSQVVHFFTRDSGIVHLLAKGSKRAKSKTGGTLDLFSEGQLVFIPPRGEAMATLVEFAESTNHSGLRRRLTTINAALYMVEITSLLLAEVDPHPEVFDLMSAALRRMDQPDAPAQAVLAFYQWRLLQHVGLLGEMSNCLACGKLASGIGVHFSSHDGGLYCPDAQTSRAQLAVFFVGALKEGTGSCANGPPYPDVAPTHFACPAIAKLKSLGLAVPCANGNFCPDLSITRGETAAFSAGALGYMAGNPTVVGSCYRTPPNYCGL